MATTALDSDDSKMKDLPSDHQGSLAKTCTSEVQPCSRKNMMEFSREAGLFTRSATNQIHFEKKVDKKCQRAHSDNLLPDFYDEQHPVEISKEEVALGSGESFIDEKLFQDNPALARPVPEYENCKINVPASKLINQLLQEKILLEKYLITKEMEFEYVIQCMRNEIQELRGFCRMLIHDKENGANKLGTKAGNLFLPSADKDHMVFSHMCDLHTKVSQLKLQLYGLQHHVTELETEKLTSDTTLGKFDEVEDADDKSGDEKEKSEQNPPQLSRFSQVLTAARGSFSPFGNNDLMMAFVDSCHMHEEAVPLHYEPEQVEAEAEPERPKLPVYVKEEEYDEACGTNL